MWMPYICKDQVKSSKILTYSLGTRTLSARNASILRVSELPSWSSEFLWPAQELRILSIYLNACISTYIYLRRFANACLRNFWYSSTCKLVCYFVVCCLLFVACCLLCVVCCLLLLLVVCCVLFVVCCCCLLRAVCCLLFVVVACCLLFVACCFLPVAVVVLCG